MALKTSTQNPCKLIITIVAMVYKFTWVLGGSFQGPFLGKTSKASIRDYYKGLLLGNIKRACIREYSKGFSLGNIEKAVIREY